MSALIGLISLDLYNLSSRAQTLSLHEDEYQHTHLAWNSFRGKIIYRDFKESHGPLSNLFYGFLLKIKTRARESVSTFYYLRYFNILIIFGTAILVGLSAFRLAPQKIVPAIAILIFFTSPATRTLAFRIRPDCYVALFSSLSFYLWLKRKHFFMGVCLGLALGFHAKYLPINLVVLVAVWFLSQENRKPFKSILVGEALIVLSIFGWFWYHRALSFTLDGWWGNGFRTAYQRFWVERDFTRLVRVVTFSDNWMLSILILFSLVWAIYFLRRKKLKWSSDWTMGSAYSLASLMFLFSPVWSHAFVFVLPTGLPFLVASLLSAPKFRNVVPLVLVALCGFWFISDLKQPDRGKDLLRGQLQSLDLALRETKRTDRIFYIWTSRCPAYVFNEDPWRNWMNPFRRDNSTDPIRMLPPINYLSIHPMFLGLMSEDERNYIQSHFKVEGCFWSRIK